MSTDKKKKNSKHLNSNLDKTKKHNINKKINKTNKTNKTTVKESSEKKSKKSNKKGKKIIMKIIIILIVIFAICALIGSAILIGIFSSSKYKITRADMAIDKFNSTVLDSEGNTIATLTGDENRLWVSLDEMPEYLPKMFVALEDERFYSHNGVDLKRTIGATLGFVTGGGSSSYGGSTITQQLIKNTYRDDEQSGLAGVRRKIREMARAMNVEKVLSKNEILELYLNKIFMGGTYYGMGTAAKYYFNKNIADLSITEGAYLVAINTSPNSYNPFDEEKDNSEKIKNKVKVVLNKFRDQAKNLDFEFTDEAFEQAMKEADEGIKFEKGSVVTTGATYSYHTAAAVEEVIKDFMKQKELTHDAAKDMVYNNGYVIHSTQVSSAQTAMEEEFTKSQYVKVGKKKNKDGTLLNTQTQSAMVIIDHSTGYVVATMGGLGENSNAIGLNRATQSTKQPGSSIKPLACLVPGLEEKIITAATVYEDSATSFGGGFAPHNAGNYNGLITVRMGIAQSSNIVNSKILVNVTTSKAMEYLKKFGITSLVTAEEDSVHNDESIASLALGGLTHGISPLEMAAAYATIANDGVYIEPTFYTKVEDNDGKVVLETQQETHKVMSPQTAYIAKEVLTSVVTSGTGGTAAMSGIRVAGKTGSTDNYQNRWFCGFTPYYAAACWYGFDFNEDPTWSGNIALSLWAGSMKKIHSGLASKGFERPSGITSATICQETGGVATPECTKTTGEYFIVGTVPKQCPGHSTKVIICKESGKLANDFCTDVEEKSYPVKPEKENTKSWTTKDNGKYDVPTETCDIHSESNSTKGTIPNVVKEKLADARKKIEAAGFKVSVVYEESKDKEEGIVLKQDKEAGTIVDKGTTITITVSKKTSKENNTVENEITNTTSNTVNPENNTVDNTVPENKIENNTTV